jgi:osmotically-inducible protein OsmY
VDAKVDERLRHAHGTADWQYQRDEAESSRPTSSVARRPRRDRAQRPDAERGDVQESIRKAFKRNAALDADDLYVSTDNGTVTINGNVSSWAEHDEAIDAAWAAPGVTSVHDNIDGGVLRRKPF